MSNSELIKIETVAAILKLLSDKTRLSMVKLVSEKESCVCELVEIYKMSQPAISQHLRKLKDKGVVKEKRKGQWIYYSINEDYQYYDYVQHLISYIPSQRYRLEELKSQSKEMTCD